MPAECPPALDCLDKQLSVGADLQVHNPKKRVTAGFVKTLRALM